MRTILVTLVSIVLVAGGCAETPEPEIRYVPVPVQAPAERAQVIQPAPAPVQTVYVEEDDSMEEYWKCYEQRTDGDPSNDTSTFDQLSEGC